MRQMMVANRRVFAFRQATQNEFDEYGPGPPDNLSIRALISRPYTIYGSAIWLTPQNFGPFVESYSMSGSGFIKAAFLALNEDFAISTCWLTAVRSSLASFLSSASDFGDKGRPQRARILLQSSSIRASVEEGTA
jgi:hypothetical protein